MAARVLEHRCPDCDHVVSSTRRTRATVGRPFEECARCGAYVARVPYEEWALMKPTTRTRIVLSSAGLALVLGLAPGGALAAAAFYAKRDLREAIVVGAIGLAVALSLWVTWLARQVGPSRRRLRDPWYQAKLAQFAIQSAKRGT
jgi:hypothetical protein